MNSEKEGLTILLIDDEYMILEMASEILSYMGHKVLLAQSGAEGLKHLHKHRDQIDLVIVDLLMPDMNGKECYEEIRKVDSHIPIVISTGISDVANKEGLKNLDVIDFLEKPYTVPQLQSVLDKLKTAGKS